MAIPTAPITAKQFLAMAARAEPIFWSSKRFHRFINGKSWPADPITDDMAQMLIDLRRGAK